MQAAGASPSCWSLSSVIGLHGAVALAEVASRFDGHRRAAGLRADRLRTARPGSPSAGCSPSRASPPIALIAQVMFDYAAALWPALEEPGCASPRITLYALVSRSSMFAASRAGCVVGNFITIAKLLPLGLIALAGLWFAGWNNLPVAEPRAAGWPCERASACAVRLLRLRGRGDPSRRDA